MPSLMLAPSSASQPAAAFRPRLGRLRYMVAATSSQSGGGRIAPSAGSTIYFAPDNAVSSDGATWGFSSDFLARMRVRGHYLVTRIQTTINANTTSANSTLTLIKNGVATNLVTTITAGVTNTTWASTAGVVVELLPGDYVSLRLSSGGTGQLGFDAVSTIWQEVIDSPQYRGGSWPIAASGPEIVQAVGDTGYAPLAGGNTAGSLTEADILYTIRTYSEWHHLYVVVSPYTVVGGSSVWRMRKNSADGVGECTGTADDQFIEDTQHVDRYLAGDTIDWLQATAGSSGGAGASIGGSTYTGAACIFAVWLDFPAGSAVSSTKYLPIEGHAKGTGATVEAFVQTQLVTGKFYLRNLYVKPMTNTVGGGVTTVTVRLNNADTTLTVSVGSGSTAVVEDTTHVVLAGNAPTDVVAIKVATNAGGAGIKKALIAFEMVPV